MCRTVHLVFHPVPRGTPVPGLLLCLTFRGRHPVLHLSVAPTTVACTRHTPWPPRPRRSQSARSAPFEVPAVRRTVSARSADRDTPRQRLLAAPAHGDQRKTHPWLIRRPYPYTLAMLCRAIHHELRHLRAETLARCRGYRPEQRDLPAGRKSSCRVEAFPRPFEGRRDTWRRLEAISESLVHCSLVPAYRRAVVSRCHPQG